jgi:hypothetical protein
LGGDDSVSSSDDEEELQAKNVVTNAQNISAPKFALPTPRRKPATKKAVKPLPVIPEKKTTPKKTASPVKNGVRTRGPSRRVTRRSAMPLMSQLPGADDVSSSESSDAEDNGLGKVSPLRSVVTRRSDEDKKATQDLPT